MRLVVGFAGLMESGKDTAAKVLIERGFERFAFADKLKEMALKFDPYVCLDDSVFCRLSEVVNDIGWDRAKKECPEIRRFLQVEGTECGRDVWGDNCWVNIVRQAAAGKSRVVITDVRFPNECQAVIDEEHGMVQRINRPGLKAGNHASESQITNLPVSCEIMNEGTVEQLHAQVLLRLDDFISQNAACARFVCMYRNYRDEESPRFISCRYLWFGSTRYHQEPQWMLRGMDIEKQAPRDFAVKDIRHVHWQLSGEGMIELDALLAS